MSSAQSLANYLRHAGHASASSLNVRPSGQSTPTTFRTSLFQTAKGTPVGTSYHGSSVAALVEKPTTVPAALRQMNLSAVAGHDAPTTHFMKHLQLNTRSKAKTFRLIAGATSDKGERPINQDATLIVERLFDQDDHSLFAVFDGHGTEGHKAANFVKEMFVKVLENYRQLLIVDPATAMKRAFRDIHDLLIENDDIDTYMSGTTASVVVWRGDQLIVANLGDSRVVLGRKALSAAQRATNPYASIKSAPAQAIDLTTDHTCYNPRELERVLRMGARVQKLEDETDEQAPLRIFKGSLPYPGIVVSRSLGDDVAQRLGVLCDPDVMVYTLTPNDCYLLIATDGVWDGMSSQEAITLVEQFAMTHQANASEASKHLNREALAALDRRQIDDNVSNVCVFITYQ